MRVFPGFMSVILALSAGCTVLFSEVQQSSPTAEITNTPYIAVARETPSIGPDTPIPILSKAPKSIPTMTPTSTSTPITYNPCNASTPSDPSSLSIAFAAKWDGDLEIYTVHADGSNLTQLTNNATDDVAPIWSPDGDKLTFVSERSGKPGQLYLMKSDGTEQTPLTPDHFAIVPLAWSLDSRYIGLEGVHEGINDFFVMDLTDASLTKLTSSEGYFGLGDLTWSPSGDTLAFDVGLDSSGAMRGVILVKLDRPELQKLLPQPSSGYSDSLPQWHPMDDLILLISAPVPEFSSEQIYVVKSDGSNRQPLTHTDTRKTRAAWSPNGQIIAYGTLTYTTDSQGKYIVLDEMIYVLNRDGTDQRLVVKGKGVQSDRLSWAPDSRHLAFISSETENSYDLFFADICKNGTYLIAKNIANYTPTWGH